MKFYLIVASGKKKGMPVPISGDLFLMGSEKMCQLRSRLPGIGGKHCAVVVRDRKVSVRDMSSGEPTLLNGNVIPPGDALHQLGRLRATREIMEARHRRADAMVAEQNAGAAGIFGGHKRNLAEDAQRPQRNVFEIPNRCADDVQRPHQNAPGPMPAASPEV